MPVTDKTPLIEEVAAIAPATLIIRWTTGEIMQADIGDWINRFAMLAPIKDTATFGKARVGWHGHSVEWGDDIKLGADQLYIRCNSA